MDTQTYFSPKRTAISVHRAKDFRLSREYYHRKHVLGAVPDDPTFAMNIGSMLDAAWTAFDHGAIDQQFAVKPPEGDPRTAVRQADMDRAKQMASGLLATELPKFYAGKRSESQVPLFGKLGGVEVCCLPDRVTLDGSVAYIDELKSATGSRIKNAKAWWYHCLDMGYFEQLAIQRYL